MSAFEYVSVMASIVIGLALADILTSLHRLFRAGPLVRWHWAAPVAAGLVVLTLIQIWWSLYTPDDTPMTVVRFLPILVELILLFLLAARALPDAVPAEGLDLRVYYDTNGRWFWALFTAALGWLMLVGIITTAATGEVRTFLGHRIADLAILAVFASLIFVRRLWWHMIAFAVLSLGPLGWLSKSLI